MLLEMAINKYQFVGKVRQGLAVEVCRKSCHNMSQSSNHPSLTKTETETTKITIRSITSTALEKYHNKHVFYCQFKFGH